MDRILIVYHSQSGVVKEMADAVKKGIEKTKKIQVVFKIAQDANWDDLKDSAGIAIGTPDYFDYMAGSIKDFFDRTFYPSQSKTEGSLVAEKPCVFFVSGGTGGVPAIQSLKKISDAFRFNVIDSVAGGGKLTEELLEECENLGEKLATVVLQQ